MTASELIDILRSVPPDTPIRVGYDAGCAWGWLKDAHKTVLASSGEIEVELEVD